MVFERQPPSPEVCICNENIINNKVLARGPLPPIWFKLVPKRLPKGGLGPPFEDQGRREGHGDEKTEVPKSFRNTFEIMRWNLSGGKGWGIHGLPAWGEFRASP